MGFLIDPFRSGGTTAAFDPMSLYAGGTYKGFWLDATDTSRLFQNSGGTGAVTADGDPVGYVSTQGFTNAGNFTQATSGSRPTYKVVGGLGVLRFAGSQSLDGDTTIRGFMGGLSVGTYVVVAKATNTSAIFDDNASNYQPIGFNYINTNQFRAYDHGAWSEIAATTYGTMAVHTYRRGSSDALVRVNNGSWGSRGAAAPTASAGTGVATRLAPEGSFVGDISQIFAINTNLSDALTLELERALGAKAGVTI